MAAEPRQTSIAKEDETGGSAPSLPLARPAFVLFEVCTRAAGPQWMRPAARTQQRPRGLESKCTQACPRGKTYGGHVLDVHACMYKGKAMEYTSGSTAVRCAIGMCIPVCLPGPGHSCHCWLVLKCDAQVTKWMYFRYTEGRRCRLRLL